LLKPGAYQYFFSVLGLMTGYHLVSNIMEFGFRQADIRRSGPLFSLVFCAFAALLAFGFLIAFVIGGLRGGIDFLSAGAGEARSLIAGGWSVVSAHLGVRS